MKAAVFYGKEILKIEDIPVPKPGSGQVLVRVHACGICGTDVHIFSGDEGAAPSPPGTVLGHEFAGEIVEIGKDVTGLKAGDRVCVDPNKLCGNCGYCREGLGHFCENMTGIGTTVNGGFAEYCCVPASQVYPFAEHITYEQAAMTEPVACCLHGIDMCGIRCGDTVAVIGAGMIGLLMLQLARLSGAGRAAVIEPIEEKRRFARELGADIVIDPVRQDAAAVLREAGIDRVGTVIECVGRIETMEQAIRIAGKKSTVMLFGLTKPDDILPVKPFELFKKEITLKASYINPYTQKRALGLIESGRLDVASMIYGRIPLEELPGLLADRKRRSLGKYIVAP